MTVTSRELIERMRAALPLAMTLPDPITGAPFTVNRDNVLALLVIDASNLVLESQMVAMLFGEMARVHAAAKLAREQADVEFRQWKSRKAAAARATLTNGVDAKGNAKPPTNDQVEEAYRSDREYSAEYQKVNRAIVVADLIADLKEAFSLKQRALHDLHGVTFGHDRVAQTDERMRELEERMEAAAAPHMRESGAELTKILAENQGPPPPEPATGKATATGKLARRPSTKGTES